MQRPVIDIGIQAPEIAALFVEHLTRRHVRASLKADHHGLAVIRPTRAQGGGISDRQYVIRYTPLWNTGIASACIALDVIGACFL